MTKVKESKIAVSNDPQDFFILFYFIFVKQTQQELWVG